LIGLITVLILGYFYYKSYMAIKSVPCIDVNRSQLDDHHVVVDFRDYNNLSENQAFQAIVIPIPYLKRFYHEIPRKHVYVIASNKLEKNIGIRFLQKHGFQVTGYSLAECACHNNTRDMVM
jgi:hypothetical protein